MLRALQCLPRWARVAILQRRLRFREQEVSAFTAEVAYTAADALASARLVHDAYVQRGLAHSHASGVRATPWHFLPSSFVIVAKLGAEVVGTQTLQVDSPFGLPMDEAFSSALAPFRSRARVVAEIGALAITPRFRGAGVFHLLNRAMFALAERIGVHDLVAVVNPVAEDVYRALLCFDRVGAVTRYPGLAQPRGGTALHLSLDDARERMRQTAPASHAIYIERAWNEIRVPVRLSVDALEDGRLEGVRALVAERRDVVRALSRRQIEELRRVVPDLFWPTPSQLDPSEVIPTAGRALVSA
jgi:GNAT superfamily N-acetyltransferase